MQAPFLPLLGGIVLGSVFATVVAIVDEVEWMRQLFQLWVSHAGTFQL